MSYADIMKRLYSNGVVILDGATGTELERRGADMHSDAWCGPANLHARQLLEQVHTDYIHAGAEIITTNTFATSRMMLEPGGYADRIEDIYHNACAAAHQARQNSNQANVLIAGSLSHMVPVPHGEPLQADPYIGLGKQRFSAAIHEAAALLKQGGCDLIIAEMMYKPGRIEIVLDAAMATGLPVWVGFSVRTSSDGKLIAHAHDREIPFAELLDLLPVQGVDVAGVMHSNVTVTGSALAELRSHFTGPLMAYPDSGYFRMPHWKFEEIISPGDFKFAAREWINNGTQVIGGCCGLSVEHIRTLAELKR